MRGNSETSPPCSQSWIAHLPGHVRLELGSRYAMSFVLIDGTFVLAGVDVALVIDPAHVDDVGQDTVETILGEWLAAMRVTLARLPPLGAPVAQP